MTMNQQRALELRRKHFFPNQNHYYQEPFFPVRAEGNTVWDDEGRPFLDFIGGIVSISVGHNHPRIKKKIQSMVESNAIQHTTSLYLSLYAGELAEKLSKVAPEGLSRCYLTNSGSEANEVAILTARVSTGEQMIVALRHAYHGGTSGTLSLCGQKTWKFPSQPVNPVTHAFEPNCYRCPFGATKESCHLECAEDIKRVIETTTHGKIAGFICEPVLGAGGFITPPLEYHRRAAEIVRSYGGKYISDEVQTGIGRTGKTFFAIEESGVKPDLVTMAKGLGSGAAIGAVLATDQVSQPLAGKIHFNTFGGDPYQTMQAAEVIDIIRDERLIDNSRTMGDYLLNGFKSLQKDFGFLGDVRGRGLMVGLELVKDPKSKEPAPELTALFLESARKNGLLLGKGGLYGNVIRIAPSLGVSQAECQSCLDKCKLALEEVKRSWSR